MKNIKRLKKEFKELEKEILKKNKKEVMEESLKICFYNEIVSQAGADRGKDKELDNISIFGLYNYFLKHEFSIGTREDFQIILNCYKEKIKGSDKNV